MSLVRFSTRFVPQTHYLSLISKSNFRNTLATRRAFSSTALLFGVSGMKYSAIEKPGSMDPLLWNSPFANQGLSLNLCRKITTTLSPLNAPQDPKVVQNLTAKSKRYVPSKEITKNITVYSENAKTYDIDSKTLKLKNVPKDRPLAIVMAWLLAKPKQLKNYIDIYINLGFDVVTIATSPWQLLWPTKGTQMIAKDAVKFLENNPNYSQLLVHGFSVGAYQFSELMVIMSQNMERYKPILDRFQCQIWDSAADITEIPVGVPKAIFPKNMRLQSALRNYTLYHMKTFHNQATIHYMRGSQMFHSTLVKAPALFFVSENDLVGPTSSNTEVKNNWEPAGIKVTFQSWKKSGHVAHLFHHREEYIAMLYKHLEENMLEQLALKARAKL